MLTVLLPAALLPALLPDRAFGGQSPSLLAAFQTVPEPNPDVAKLASFDAAHFSVLPFAAADRKDAAAMAREQQARAAMQAHPAWLEGRQELTRVFEIHTQRIAIRVARLRLIASALLVVAALGMVGSVGRFRRGTPRSGALLLVGSFTLVPLAIPSAADGIMSVPMLSLFTREPTTEPAPSWRQQPPAAAGEVWTPAAIDAARPYVPFTYPDAMYDNRDITTEVRRARSGLLLSGLAAVVALALIACRRPIARLWRWAPSYRRHFPTFWPAAIPN